jgi:hypothetical protein
MRLQVTINLEINPEEYPLPIDGDVRDEVEQIIRDTFYDIEGIEIEAIKTSKRSMASTSYPIRGRL